LTPPGEGIWTEIVVTSSRLTSETNLPLWRYDSPVITSISPTEVPPQAGETVLTIVGYNFGWRPSNATSFVTVASRACATLDWSDTVISCLLPLGTRSAAVMAVAASGLATVREGAGNVTYLRYLPPMVQSVSPRLLPTVGDVVVTVKSEHTKRSHASSSMARNIGKESRAHTYHALVGYEQRHNLQRVVTATEAQCRHVTTSPHYETSMRKQMHCDSDSQEVRVHRRARGVGARCDGPLRRAARRARHLQVATRTICTSPQRHDIGVHRDSTSAGANRSPCCRR
jgi:hypothetical protein